MYQSNFLAPVWGYARRADVVAHLAHVVNVAGEGAVAIGTDYDGMIVPPRDLPDVTAHPLLVQDLLDLGWSERLIRRALGENYLRVLRGVRP
jgi:membrane dipeptidase